MNLRTISKTDLLNSIEKLVAEERRITSQILWHLFEIERRRLFAELGFASLFEYTTVQLRYSAGSAQRRISAMRLLREMPEVAEKIESGKLNVNALSQAQSMFRQARMENKAFTVEAKRELVEKLENKSQRECEKVLAEINPATTRPSRERVVTASRTEIRFEADEELYTKIQILKGKLAHRLKGSNDFAELLNLLVDDALNKKPSKKPLPPVEVESKSSTSRYIPKAVARAVFEKAKNQCTYVDPDTNRRCSSTFALQIEHRQPLALGGKTEFNNLTILCRTHNQLAAIQQFGFSKMETYLKPFAF